MSPALKINDAHITMRFSKCDLLVAIGGICVTLITFWQYGIRGASVMAFVLGIALAMHGSKVRSARRRVIGKAVAIPAGCVTGFFSVAWIAFGVGPIYLQSQWPYALKQMASVAEANRWNVSAEFLGGFLDRDYIWQLAVPTPKLADVLDSCQMSEVDGSAVPLYFRACFLPSWRLTSRTANRYFATRDFPANFRGEDGEHYFAMYDPVTQRLSVWYKSNF